MSIKLLLCSPQIKANTQLFANEIHSGQTKQTITQSLMYVCDVWGLCAEPIMFVWTVTCRDAICQHNTYPSAKSTIT